MPENRKTPPGVPDVEMEIEDLVTEYTNNGIHRVKLAITDMDGVMRGKYLSLDKFRSLADSMGCFCDCVLGWDVDDKLYDNAKFTGWHTAYPDALFRIDRASERRIPDENNLPLFLADFKTADGSSHPLCPRSLYQRLLKRAQDMGFFVRMGFEYEFFVFNETPESVRAKHYQDLRPFTPGNFGYSIIRNSVNSDLFNAFMDYCLAMDCPLEGLHCETGPGVWEGALGSDLGVKAPDKAAVFKTFTKTFFQKRGLMATFMAKWSMDYPGLGGHVHQSLVEAKTGRSVFYDKAGRFGMSKSMEHYLAGLRQYLRPFLAMSAPTVNSYTRLVKGAWAPTSLTWGVENRTTALRVIPGSEKSQRLEYRLPGADANPYLVASACLAAGLLGIERKLDPGDPVTGCAYDDSGSEAHRLPSNLRQAIAPFRESAEAVEMFGGEFVEHFAGTREWEVREYERSINDWQLKRYFEII